MKQDQETMKLWTQTEDYPMTAAALWANRRERMDKHIHSQDKLHEQLLSPIINKLLEVIEREINEQEEERYYKETIKEWDRKLKHLAMVEDERILKMMREMNQFENESTATQ